MLGILGNLKAGQQGGGVKRKQQNLSAPQLGASASSAASASASAGHALQRQKQHQVAQERNLQLPEWIKPNARLGYVSRSSGKMSEVIVDKVSRAEAVVKIVFAADRGTWKGIPFSMILSRMNPLRKLGEKGPRAGEMNNLLDRAQASQVDKSIMLQRLAPTSSSSAATGVVEAPVPQPLVGGIARRVVPDAAISASSYFMNNPRHGLGQMWRCRIDNTDSAWRANVDSQNQCVRWDFGGVRQLVRVHTKGSAVEDQWVTEYDLSYSEDGVTWTRLGKTFLANEDRDSVAEVVLDPPIRASSVRLHPLAWHEHISLRCEFHGFEEADAAAGDLDVESAEGPAGPMIGPEPAAGEAEPS
eukprot:TRINITY_DN76278_c0_g1_i1.p1 TRINITY_DN76278_c0_g1~~TRINITY_DN76278_c0_g1_i1.p1  ORF type:complete len:358 (-),score=98.44 TRINITY_DN76278_c0_g1_i1:169-1242(-)